VNEEEEVAFGNERGCEKRIKLALGRRLTVGLIQGGGCGRGGKQIGEDRLRGGTKTLRGKTSTEEKAES